MQRPTGNTLTIIGILATMLFGVVQLTMTNTKVLDPLVTSLQPVPELLVGIQDQIGQMQSDLSNLDLTLTEVGFSADVNQRTGPVWLQLVSIRCVEPEDAGGDEAYLRVGGRRVWSSGRSMGSDDEELLSTLPATRFTENIDVSLWDEDGPQWLDSDDRLGTIRVRHEQVGQRDLTGQFTLDGANYVLTYRVVASIDN